MFADSGRSLLQHWTIRHNDFTAGQEGKKSIYSLAFSFLLVPTPFIQNVPSPSPLTSAVTHAKEQQSQKLDP